MMNRKTCTTLALAAAMAMGSMTFAQEGPRNPGGEGVPTQTGERPRTPMPETDATRDPVGKAGSTANRASDRMGDMAGMSAADAAVAKQLADIRTTPDKAADRLFALNAAMGNAFEIRYSELVARRAQDPKVKELAQMMIRDHTQANEKLMPVARKLNVTPPTDLPSMKQQKLAIYEAMSPTDLETAYLVDQKEMHAKDVTCYADRVQTVKDADLRAYAQEVLPKLQQHSRHVVEVAQSNGIKGEMTTLGGTDSTRSAGERRE